MDVAKEILGNLLKEYPATLLASLCSLPISYILFGWYRFLYGKFLSVVSQELTMLTLIAVGMFLVLALAYVRDLRKRVKKLDATLNENIELKRKIDQLDPGELPSDAINILEAFGNSESGSLTISNLCQYFGVPTQLLKHYLDVLINKHLICEEDPFDYNAGDYRLTAKGRAYLQHRGLL